MLLASRGIMVDISDPAPAAAPAPLQPGRTLLIDYLSTLTQPNIASINCSDSSPTCRLLHHAAITITMPPGPPHSITSCDVNLIQSLLCCACIYMHCNMYAPTRLDYLIHDIMINPGCVAVKYVLYICVFRPSRLQVNLDLDLPKVFDI